MKIGIISDTHDDLDSVRQAVLLFKKKNVDLVIHAGDYVYPGVVEKFADLPNARLVGVLGNNDGEKIGLFQRFSKVGGELKGDFCEMDIDGLKFGI
jgi:putative phosphoesterase